MITPEMIERINALSRKEKSEGLTPEEKEEQKMLREAYIEAFKANLKAQLDNIVVVDENGNPVKKSKNSSKNKNYKN